MNPELLLVHPKKLKAVWESKPWRPTASMLTPKSGSSFAIEVSGDIVAREQQLELNRVLTAHTGDVLAQPIGAEWFLTVNNGHASQFCKSASMGCRTPAPLLTNADGCMTVDTACGAHPVL